MASNFLETTRVMTDEGVTVMLLESYEAPLLSF